MYNRYIQSKSGIFSVLCRICICVYSFLVSSTGGSGTSGSSSHPLSMSTVIPPVRYPQRWTLTLAPRSLKTAQSPEPRRRSVYVLSKRPIVNGTTVTGDDPFTDTSTNTFPSLGSSFWSSAMLVTKQPTPSGTCTLQSVPGIISAEKNVVKSRGRSIFMNFLLENRFLFQTNFVNCFLVEFF